MADSLFNRFFISTLFLASTMQPPPPPLSLLLSVGLSVAAVTCDPPGFSKYPWIVVPGSVPWMLVLGVGTGESPDDEDDSDVAAEDTFRLGLSGLRMVKDSVDSFRPERTKLMVITYSVSERRPLKVVLDGGKGK